MRVLVAGATGVLGRQLVPLLSSVGHDVVGLARSAGRADALAEAGARLVTADALDAAALRRAVLEAEPEAVVHLLTAIPADFHPRRLDEAFRTTNRLRTEATRTLVDAAAAVGARRFVSQGVAFAYDPAGPSTATEDEPLWREPPRVAAPLVDALRELERRTADAGGLTLRLGHLYGPGTVYDRDGAITTIVRARRLPLVGGGGALFSFTHTHDAATAVVTALDRDLAGVLNVVDDEPVPVATWLPEFARMLGAPPPRRVPTALARLAVGPWGTAWMTRLRGADNARARLSLDWRPGYPSWREGFERELGASGVRRAA